MIYSNHVLDSLYLAWTTTCLKPTAGYYEVDFIEEGVAYHCEVYLKYFVSASGTITDEAVLLHSVECHYIDNPEIKLNVIPSPTLRSLMNAKWRWRHYTTNIYNNQ